MRNSVLVRRESASATAAGHRASALLQTLTVPLIVHPLRKLGFTSLSPPQALPRNTDTQRRRSFVSLPLIYHLRRGPNTLPNRPPTVIMAGLSAAFNSILRSPRTPTSGKLELPVTEDEPLVLGSGSGSEKCELRIEGMTCGACVEVRARLRIACVLCCC